MKPIVKIDIIKCNRCLLCVDLCPADVFTIRDNKIEVANMESCILCYGCVPLCPTSAISVEDKEMNIYDEGTDLK